MIIDLKVLRQKGLKTARFQFDYVPPEELLDLPDGRFCGNVKVIANVEVYDDEAYVDGEIVYTFEAACARCLTPVTVTRMIEYDELFLSEFSLKKDDDCYTYSRDRIDMKKPVDEMILTDIPYAVYCKEDCKGLCPICGKNLNNGDCGCEN